MGGDRRRRIPPNDIAALMPNAQPISLGLMRTGRMVTVMNRVEFICCATRRT